MDYEKIWDDAQAAAKKAADEVGARMDDGGSCGYAWVSIRPARGPFIAWLKRKNAYRRDDPYGSPFGYRPGWQVWNPGNYRGQCLCAKEAGARAFAEALRAAGIPGEIWDESRVD